MSDTGIDVEGIRAAVSAAAAGWQAGETALTQLSAEERVWRLGANPPPGEASLSEREEMARANLALHAPMAAGAIAVGYPAAYDLTNVGGNNYITPIRNQGGCGSCVAFGTAATVEGAARKMKNNPALNIDLSEAHLFYCYAEAKDGRNCDNNAMSGWWPDAAFNYTKTDGVVDEACYPYTAGDQACKLCTDWASRLTKITGWHKITNPADMKTWISTNGPLATCFTVYDDFFAYRSGIYRYVTGKVAGGHCVSIVGYDDTQSFWKCKNSWGTTFGMSGFFNIAYGQCGIDATMWAVEGVTLPAVWLNNKLITGLWTTDQDLNAWAFVDTVGWRKIAWDTPNIFFDMLTQFAAAKAARRPVNLLDDNGVIKQIYVL